MAPMAPSRPAVVVEELFTARFEAVAREMGELLRRTALSTNVKERLDFSCALLDPDGELVVNAPHIPVHLGALGLCVRSGRGGAAPGPGGRGGDQQPGLRRLPPARRDGDPAGLRGVRRGRRRLLGYVASRAHHAEIGGTRPGSMPPDATTPGRGGRGDPADASGSGRRAPLGRDPGAAGRGAHPSRSIDENLADLAAALAAGHRGAEALRGLARAHGATWFGEQMKILARRAADRLSQRPAPPGRWHLQRRGTAGRRRAHRRRP